MHTTVHPHTNKQFRFTQLYSANQYSSFPPCTGQTSVHSLGKQGAGLSQGPMRMPPQWPRQVLNSTNVTFSFLQRASRSPLIGLSLCLSPLPLVSDSYSDLYLSQHGDVVRSSLWGTSADCLSPPLSQDLDLLSFLWDGLFFFCFVFFSCGESKLSLLISSADWPVLTKATQSKQSLVIS